MGESSILVDHRFQNIAPSAYYVMRDESTIECHPDRERRISLIGEADRYTCIEKISFLKGRCHNESCVKER